MWGRTQLVVVWPTGPRRGSISIIPLLNNLTRPGSRNQVCIYNQPSPTSCLAHSILLQCTCFLSILFDDQYQFINTDPQNPLSVTPKSNTLNCWPNMEAPQSPPKRMTRARAAAKTTESSSSKPTKIVTAAAKAKTTTTRAAAPASASTTAPTSTTRTTKRKARTDESDDEERSEAEQRPAKPALRTAAGKATAARATAVKATRGRPKKTTASEPTPTPAPAPARTTRGRPPKKPATESAKEEPVRTTRTRAKKTKTDHEDDENDENDDLAAEPAKKPARGRPAGAATAPTIASKAAVKKTVKFEEPDKENQIPASGPKRKTAAAKPAETTTGLRAKPVRKPAAAARATRITRIGANDTNEEKQPKPLGPKKVTQMSMVRDVDSEDELAMDRTPAKAFHKSPVKAPASGKAPTKTEDVEPAAADDEITALAPVDSTVILGSPARRPPPSPYKDAMKSPAKRVEGVPHLGLPAANSNFQQGQSPLKAPLIQSPAKRPPMPIKALELGGPSRQDNSTSPFKMSLLQSPARRPLSPLKKAPEQSMFSQSPAPKSVLLSATPFRANEQAEQDDDADEPVEMALEEEDDSEEESTSPTQLHFPGRLSAVMPRHADPALIEDMAAVSGSDEDETDHDEDESDLLAQDQENEDIVEELGDPMVLDDPEAGDENVSSASASTTPPHSPPKQAFEMFGKLRQKDIDIDYSESEDELTTQLIPSSLIAAATPVAASSSKKTPRSRGSFLKTRSSAAGFTPLAAKLNNWSARSPVKNGSPSKTPRAEVLADITAIAGDSPAKSTFFEDEMSVRAQPVLEESNESADELGLGATAEIEEPEFDDIDVTEEDLALAAEANEMSVLDPEQVEEMLHLDTPDDSVSEASQEYGDENENPIDPTLRDSSIPPVTPQRVLRREVHTVSKVPLKPADESTPQTRPSLRKRSQTVARLPAQRPTRALSRSASVISYSPSKKRHDDYVFEEAEADELASERSVSEPLEDSALPTTPAKTDMWSAVGTPARTPRRDVNPALLRGAVVFVDVHTSEGADASGIFVELLTQMGARCVKTWIWNPNDEDASAKIGITHVVYKDGGKRTMEKVRESGGVVQCVGVSWVLE